MRANLFKTRKPMPSSVSFYISEFLKDCHPTNAYICALVWYTETRACAFSALLARRSGQRPRNPATALVSTPAIVPCPPLGGFHLGEIEQIHGCHARYFTTSTFFTHSLFHPNPNRMDAGWGGRQGEKKRKQAGMRRVGRGEGAAQTQQNRRKRQSKHLQVASLKNSNN